MEDETLALTIHIIKAVDLAVVDKSILIYYHDSCPLMGAFISIYTFLSTIASPPYINMTSADKIPDHQLCNSVARMTIRIV